MFRQPGLAAGLFCFRWLSALSAHMREDLGSRPAIELQAVGLLIGAERGARQHAGLAIDLVAIEPELGHAALHRFDLRGAELRRLAPGRLERPRIGDAVAEMADEQHV